MALSLPEQQSQIENRLTALKTYNEVSDAQKKILSKAGNSFSNVGNKFSSQLNKISEQQKRFQRDAPTSMDRVLNLLNITNGSGPESFKFLRRAVVQTLVEIGPQINKILAEETIKALGCSQEQTYTGINVGSVQVPSLALLPENQGIYIPLKNIDLSGSLKIPTPEESGVKENLSDLNVDDVLFNFQSTLKGWLGKIYYEKENPSKSDEFTPYGGPVKFPMLKALRQRTQAQGQTYENNYGAYYNGKSGELLFDMVYTNQGDLGESGDFLRVFLLDREGAPKNTSGVSLNNVTEFVQDYYSTIEPFSLPQVVATTVNYLTNFVDIKARVGFAQMDAQNKFALILNRILGLCFDDREEIDVSGNAKVGELDGVDDSFFEFTEVDLRNIEFNIADAQQGVVTFIDCDNVKLPVDADSIATQIVEFSDNLPTQTKAEQVDSIEKIIDSITKDPKWKLLYPNTAGIDVSISKNFIKQIPVALASSILNPKVLLPLMTMFKVLEKNAREDANDIIRQQNELISSANTILKSGTTIGQQVSKEINDGVDFVKKNKTFVIAMVSRISAIFIETLFEILKREIFVLLEIIIRDINKSATLKKYAIVLRLVQLAYVIGRFVRDYRKCKSLLDEIAMLLQMISNSVGAIRLPAFLNLFAALLPGFSPERATLNVIEELQKLGIPTGPGPDGSDNLMNQFVKSVISGIDSEESQNGKVQTSVALAPPIGLISTYGKKM